MLRRNKIPAILSALAFFFLLPFASGAEKTPVIVISIDTLRADHLSAYGYTRVRTPNIESLGERGTIYQHIDSQAPMTLPSHTVLMTSTYPFENRVQANGTTLPAGAVTLASVLKANGYRTAAFIGSMILERRTGFVKGFDTYDSPYGYALGEKPDFSSPSVRRDGAQVASAAEQWIDQNRAEPFFAFIHLYDLHTPYKLPVKSVFPAVAGYDAELEHVDQVIGQLRDSLKRNGVWDKALVILLADHGESLGDHGETSHGYFIYESTVHVPLIVHWPAGAAPHPRRSTELGGLIDVAPTILDFLHIAPPPSFRGVTLLSSHERTPYGEAVFPREEFGWAMLRSLQSGPYKYIDAPKPELYDLLKDPREQTNVLSAHPDEARSMKARLEALVAQRGSAPDRKTAATVPAATSAMLRSLGYTSGGQAGRDQAASAIDPKDRVQEMASFERASELATEGEYDKAIALFQQIVTEDPKNFSAAVQLRDACSSAPAAAACKEH